MSSAIEYLEAARVDELASELVSQGYDVERPSSRGDPDFDLVARRGSSKIAIEVTAGPVLRQSGHVIRQLRDRAVDEGFSAFRLVVVNPPREIVVDIRGFNSTLVDHMRSHFPSKPEQLSKNAQIVSVSEVNFREVHVDEAGIRVSGSGIVDVSLESDGDNGDETTIETDFPFSFAVALNHQLEIEGVEELDIDTSSFDE